MTEIIREAFSTHTWMHAHTPLLVLLLFRRHFIFVFDFSFCAWFDGVVVSWLRICSNKENTDFSPLPLPLPLISVKWHNRCPYYLLYATTDRVPPWPRWTLLLRNSQKCQHIHQPTHALARMASISSQEKVFLSLWQMCCWNINYN